MIDGDTSAGGSPGRMGVNLRMRHALRWLQGLPRLAVHLALANSWISLMLAVSAVMMVAILVVIIMPGYTSPTSRLFTSKFGYGAVLRKMHKPFPVTATRPVRRVLGRSSLGEGLVRSEPYIVAIVPMGVIRRVLVAEGDLVEKGQLVAEVDSTKALIKADAALSAVVTAKAELERVRIGSSYVLAYERPAKDRILLEAAEREADLQRRIQDINFRLAGKGYVLKENMLKQELLVIQSQTVLRQMKFNLGMSEKGVDQSVLIAEAAVRDAELALRHRLFELAEYKVFAVASGRVERLLVHEGEYNQDPGKPGLLIAAGAWFEANFDQGVYRKIAVGDRAEVRLEAAPERVLQGTILRVNPFVTYDLGGPESQRPIRPMGTGSPEWPATFTARIEVSAAPGVPVLSGMTGFACIKAESEATCLLREAVFAVTAGKGMVYLIDGDKFIPKEVTLGVIDGDYIEVREGLGVADLVIADGHQVLEPADRIRIIPGP